MKVADGLEPDAVIGPLIDMEAVEAHIADASASSVMNFYSPLTSKGQNQFLRTSSHFCTLLEYEFI